VYWRRIKRERDGQNWKAENWDAMVSGESCPIAI
jgi:hypothetical protein